MNKKLILVLTFLCLLSSHAVNAELSFTNQWRVDRAEDRCEEANNEFIYKDYWGDTVKPENVPAVCMAEYFAEQVASDGDTWLEKKSVNLIEQCKKQGKGKEKVYFSCLQSNLEKTAKILAFPCVELAKENLWKEDRCERLVSYIFISRFNEILEANKPFHEKMMLKIEKLKKNVVAQFLLHPLVAILFLIIYVLHFVYIVEPGNWLKVTRVGVSAGLLVGIACIIEGGLRYFLSGVSMVIIVVLMIWNHKTMKHEDENPFRKT